MIGCTHAANSSESAIRIPASVLGENLPPRTDPEPRTPDPEPIRPPSLFHRLHHDTRATVALTFMFTFPILLIIFSIITQYALVVNARIMVQHAVDAAARSALTSLPTDPAVDTLSDNQTPLDGLAFLNRSARIQLTALSPQTTPNEEGRDIYLAMKAVGLSPPASFASRYTFATAASTLTWQRLDDGGGDIGEAPWTPSNFSKNTGQRLRLTLTYDFLLTAPVANHLIGRTDTIAGLQGRYLTLTASTIVQLSPGREVMTDPAGNPIYAIVP